MANFVITAGTVLLGTAWTGTAPGTASTPSGTITSTSDITSYVTSIELPLAIDVKENTNMGSGGYKSQIAGIKSAEIKLGLNQDFAASALHALLWTTIGFGTTAYIDVKATSASRSATNPSYVFAFILSQYTPIMGSVGDKLGLTVSWPVTGAFTALTS